MSYAQIPDLSNLPMHHVKMVTFLMQGKLNDFRCRALIVNFVRLADLAVREYEAARISADTYYTPSVSVDQGGGSTETEAGSVIHAGAPATINYGEMMASSAHFETCVSTLDRTIILLEKIKQHKPMPKQYKDRLAVKSINVLRNHVKDQVGAMRNAIQHLEGDILDGKISTGQPFFVCPGRSSIMLGPREILYNDLAIWLREVNRLAGELLR